MTGSGTCFWHFSLKQLIVLIVLLSHCAWAATNLNIKLVSTLKPSANPLSYGDVWAENDVACMGVWLSYSTYNYGVGIFSISNPAAPVLLSVYSPSPTSQNQFELGALRNRIGFFGSWSGGGLHIVSLTNPAAPILLCRIGSTNGTVTNGFDRVHTVWLERNYLYEAAHVAGIQSVKVFDVSNPSLPAFLQNIVTTNTTKVHQITVRTKGAATLLFTSGWGGQDDGNLNSPGQTDIWDVSNIGTQPAQWLGRVYSGYNSHSSYPTPDGNTLVVCRETPGGDVRFYDISNPASLTSNTLPFMTLSPASMGMEADIPHNPVVVSNYLFQSWYQNGLQIFDITDRTRPIRVGFYDTYPAAETSSYQGNWGVFPYLGFDKVLLSDIQSGLFIVDATPVLTASNNFPPLIISQPASITVTQGSTATFSAVATGSSLTYQWRFNGAAIPGATDSALALSNAVPAMAGNYALVLSNASSTLTSMVASLSVVATQVLQAPNISAQPANLSVFQGEDAAFSVAASGSAPLAFQWRFDGQNIQGATNNAFARSNVQPENVGNYSVVISNPAGSVTSSNALLTLRDSPYITGVQATPGARAALISWNTTVPADSLVQFDPATVSIQQLSSSAAESGFSSSSYLDSALTTNHVVLLSGLTRDTRYSFQAISTAGTNHYVSGVYQFVTAGNIVLDNSNATLTGTWTVGTSSTDKFGGDYLFATAVAGSPTGSAVYRPTIITPGKYDVYAWYPQGRNRANNTPYAIHSSNGTRTVLVNQQTGGGAWQLLASALDFDKGAAGYVAISNNANPSVVLADAVRFSYVEAQDLATGTNIPAWWQNFFFGGAVDPSIDPDGDGFTTAQEYVTGTSPTNAVSHLQFSSANVSNNAQLVFWPLLGDRSYQLLSRPDIGPSGWQTLPLLLPTPTAEGGGLYTLRFTNNPQSFYRLKIAMSTNAAFSGSLTIPQGKSLSSYASDPICGPNRAYVK
jgi:hypothetical protein